jgi:hypothetical protein
MKPGKNVIQLPTARNLRRDPDSCCPRCEDYMILNLGRQHYGICESHNYSWHIGENLYSGWREEDPRSWADNEQRLLATDRVEEGEN